MNRARIGAAFLAACCSAGAIVLVSRRTVADSAVLRFGPWSYAEWLINYRGGFVRRGLIGSAMLSATDAASYVPATNWLVFLSFAAFAIGLAALATASSDRIGTIALAMFAPGSLITMSLGGGYFYRKEILFHLSAVTAALLVVAMRHVPMGRARTSISYIVIIFITTAVTVLSLVHEGFFFMSAPTHVLLVFTAAVAANIRRPMALAASVAMYALALFVLSVCFSGTDATADAIWTSLPSSDRQIIAAATPTGNRLAIDALRWGLLHATAMSWQVVLSGYAWYWFAAAAAGLYFVVIISDRLAIERGIAVGPENLSGILVACTFAFTLPLYALGWDWGRWISAATVQSLVVVLVLVPRERQEAQRLAIACGHAGHSRAPVVKVVTTGVGSAGLVTMGATIWLPECCIGSGTETFLASVLNLIGRAI